MVQQYVQEFLFKSQLVKNYYLTRLYETSFMVVALTPSRGFRCACQGGCTVHCHKGF